MEKKTLDASLLSASLDRIVLDAPDTQGSMKEIYNSIVAKINGAKSISGTHEQLLTLRTLLTKDGDGLGITSHERNQALLKVTETLDRCAKSPVS